MPLCTPLAQCRQVPRKFIVEKAVRLVYGAPPSRELKGYEAGRLDEEIQRG